METWTRTYFIPLEGPGVERIKVPIPDQADVEVQTWTSGTDGKVNLILLNDDVPVQEAENRMEPASTMEGPAGLVDCIMAVPSGKSGLVPIPDAARRMTLFWDRKPEQTFCVTISFRIRTN